MDAFLLITRLDACPPGRRSTHPADGRISGDLDDHQTTWTPFQNAIRPRICFAASLGSG